MDRDNAVREILQSIGPLFPEDAEKARAARKEALLKAEQASLATADAPVEPDAVKLTVAPKPVLASQVDNPATEKTGVASLAAVLDRLTPPPPATSVRDAIPGLVRPIVPDVAALRAALNLRDQPAAAEPAPEAVTAAPMFTELPKDVGETTVVAAAADEAAPVEVVAETAAVEDTVAPREAAALTTAADFSEDEHDAFVAAVAEALLHSDATEADAPVESRAIEPEVVMDPMVEMTAPVTIERPAAPAEPVARKPKFKRAKPKKEASAASKPVVVSAPVEAKPAEFAPSAPEPARELVTAVEPASREDDELIRQIRTHRADMVDVDEQLEKLDQAIAAEKKEMARYVALVEQKNAHRARLVRLRLSTQRFVETLQVKAEPVKRTPKQKKSA